MMIEIPGYEVLELKYLLLDYNGTIAADGRIPETVKRRIRALAEVLEIYVLTADTHGDARENCKGLPLQIRVFPKDDAITEKRRIAERLGADACAAVGNGRNDLLMLKESKLSIAVMACEGVYSGLLPAADICVRSMEEALDLLLYPKRLIATLRG